MGYFAPLFGADQPDISYDGTRCWRAHYAVLFPERGYASMLAALGDGETTEVGMIGHEGMIGLPLIFGTDRSLVEAMVQGEGTAIRLAADTFQRALEQRPTLR
jgi:CRP-like cAMP-binding protein